MSHVFCYLISHKITDYDFTTLDCYAFNLLFKLCTVTKFFLKLFLSSSYESYKYPVENFKGESASEWPSRLGRLGR